FDLSTGAPRLAAKQAQFLGADVYWGDPVQTSLRAAGDVTLLKPATDVILSGRAVAEHGSTEVMEVRFSLGALKKTLRIFGNRHWTKQGKDWTISHAEPCERMPLRWEQAFGGIGKIVDDKPPEHEARNPVGMG